MLFLLSFCDFVNSRQFIISNILKLTSWHSKELSKLTHRNAKDAEYAWRTVRLKASSFPSWSTTKVIIMPKWLEKHA